MRNTTRQPKTRKQYPSDKTQWAYWMQAIEPTSEAINAAFPGYHPQWVQMSQMRKISPEVFKGMRETLGLNQARCAAYLRVDTRTIRRWENGEMNISFAAFELLRLVSESIRFKVSHKDWDGWFISDKGVLVSPDLGCRQNQFTPERLNWLSLNSEEASRLRGEVARLKAELDEAKAMNTKLRKMFLSQGVVDELYDLQDRMNGLVKQLATAHIVPFHVNKCEVIEDKHMEKVA